MALAVLIALIVGATIALQAATIGRLTIAINPLTISLSLMVSGVVIGGVWASLHSAWTDVATVARLWWWLPLGAAGWLIVGALGWTSERLGVTGARDRRATVHSIGNRCRPRHSHHRPKTDHRPGAHCRGHRCPPRRLRPSLSRSREAAFPCRIGES